MLVLAIPGSTVAAGTYTVSTAQPLGNLIEALRRFFVEFAGNRFIFRRSPLRGLAHWLIMWGCVLAAAITFPLVWGWIHFETVPGHLEVYRTFVFGVAVQDFPVDSLLAFVIFHGLVWSSFLVIGGARISYREMHDRARRHSDRDRRR